MKASRTDVPTTKERPWKFRGKKDEPLVEVECTQLTLCNLTPELAQFYKIGAFCEKFEAGSATGRPTYESAR